jgi:hypothetical protein
MEQLGFNFCGYSGITSTKQAIWWQKGIISRPKYAFFGIKPNNKSPLALDQWAFCWALKSSLFKI